MKHNKHYFQKKADKGVEQEGKQLRQMPFMDKKRISQQQSVRNAGVKALIGAGVAVGAAPEYQRGGCRKKHKEQPVPQPGGYFQPSALRFRLQIIRISLIS